MTSLVQAFGSLTQDNYSIKLPIHPIIVYANNDMGHFTLTMNNKMISGSLMQLYNMVYRDIEQTIDRNSIVSFKMKSGLKRKMYNLSGTQVQVDFSNLC
jgi:hypothetical protein